MLNWCFEIVRFLTLVTIVTISFTRKVISINFSYKLCTYLHLCCQCVKDLGVLLDCNLCFHYYIDYLFCEGLKMLGLICCITSSVSAVGYLCVLYIIFVWPKLEYSSVVWNSITVMDLFDLQGVAAL
jgi:hypothetical protein